MGAAACSLIGREEGGEAISPGDLGSRFSSAVTAALMSGGARE